MRKQDMDLKGIRRILIVVLLAAVTAIPTFGQIENIKLNEWITNWNLLGPLPLEEGVSDVQHMPGFEHDFLLKHGGEKNLQVKVGQKEKVGAENLRWIEHAGKDSIINLDDAISKRSNVAAYAYKDFYFEEEGVFILSLGTNDGGRLWVNGAEVWDHPGARGCKPDSDLIPVFFKKGKNTVLLKVEERGNSWAFCARVLPFNIETFSKKQTLFNVVTLPNGSSELRFSLAEDVISNLFKSVNLEIYTDENEANPIWSRKWANQKRMKLDIKGQDYRIYKLKVIAEANDGSNWNQQINFYAGERIDYSLFNNETTDYRIVVGNNASESEHWAATELQKYLNAISGATFKIEDDESELRENEIVIGFNKHSEKLLGEDYKSPEPVDESFIYKNVKSNIVLVGGRQRGTMYAVFSFLENTFGVRWYTPSVTIIPERTQYVFNHINRHEKPSLQVRNDFYYEAFDPTWAAHNKINGAMGFRKQHGGIEGYWAVHTFYSFMPPSEFYDIHPEYYSLIDGERVHEDAQLCLTNTDVLDIITRRLKQKIKENPSNLIYSVSQNDWRNPCQCHDCEAIVKNEGSEAGVIVWFVNQVADRIKEDYPDKYVGTLAYQYTRKPPGNIVPNENVVIRFCSIECCFAHDFKSCPENQEFLADLEGWSAISPHLYIWDYVVNFSHYIMPYPNFKVLQPNINTFIANKSIGIMEQAAYQSRGGEFAELRAYLLSKLLWDSKCNVETVIDDFMYGYYGRSGQFVKEYFDLLHSQLTQDTHIHLGLQPDDKIFSNEFIEKADKIFDQATIVSENEKIKERVQVARLPLMYLKCKKNPVSAKYDGTYDTFMRVVEREGITHFAEAGKPHFEAFKEQIINAK